MEKIRLIVGGVEWAGWQSCTIERGLDRAASAFALTLSRNDPTGLAVPPDIAPGIDIRLFAGDDLQLTGFIDVLKIGVSSSGYSIGIAGRSKVARIVKSSVVSDRAFYRRLKLSALAEQICAPFDIAVKSVGWDGSTVIDQIVLTPGDTAFTPLDRAARMAGCFITDDRDGNLCLLKISKDSADLRLDFGISEVLEWHYSNDCSDRATLYRVIGQRAGNDSAFGATVANCRGFAEDPGWTAQKIIATIRAEGNADNAECQRRANWEKAVRAAKAEELSVVMPSWRDEKGRLWEPGKKVRVILPQAKIENKIFVVQNVTFSQDINAERASLSLVPAQALIGV